ncbi:MAG TPA: DUF4337 family protein [Azospirillum sp.]|nr:DUF4337 family protein [Azospirillum sp.]
MCIATSAQSGIIASLSFDAAEALLQLAIVLASVATVIGVAGLIWLSIACATAGVLSTINGFTLLVSLPFM